MGWGEEKVRGEEKEGKGGRGKVMVAEGGRAISVVGRAGVRDSWRSAR